jgi:hypothetical protein
MPLMQLRKTTSATPMMTKTMTIITKIITKTMTIMTKAMTMIPVKNRTEPELGRRGLQRFS